ncbi:MAG: riboflavin biosynthesis protein RibF [Corallococcus sp.]|nr:riboflavin biosynthesis protein RibF [Corallococcus sp.]
MQKIEFGNEINFPIVIALGFFDCLHLGHKVIIDKAICMAQKHKCKSALFTFSNNHYAVLGKDTKLIYTFDERVSMCRKCGLDAIVYAEFDKNFMSFSADMFLDVLCKSNNVQGIVCGFDYTLGSDRKDNEYVKKYCDTHNIEFSVVDKVSQRGEKISSSLIRNLIEKHDFAPANSLLSYPYFISGVVVHGRGVGKSMEFPTANVDVSSEKLLIDGVYAATVDIDGFTYKSIVNIGAKPTFGVMTTTVEVHILNFSGDLYGKFIRFCPYKFIRPITKFASPEQLTIQLLKDKENVLND